jgi:sugar phosphate isomerase/epimerase
MIGLDVCSLNTYAATGGTLADMAALLKADDLRCVEVLGLEVDTDRQAAIAMARDAERVVGALGAEYVLSILSTPSNESIFDTVGTCTDIIGADRGSLAVKFMPTSPVASMGAAVDLCESIGFDRAGVLFDTWHFFRGTDDVTDLEAFPMAALGYAQFDDNAKRLYGFEV